MSTRSMIGIEYENGKIRSVYCHFDGYLEHVGETLSRHYSRRRRVVELLAPGDMSCLRSSVIRSEYYGRDRGEQGTAARVHASRADFVAHGVARWADYLYLYSGGRWLFRRARGSSFRPLPKRIAAPPPVTTPPARG